jgi:hypothetical protein
MRRRANTYGFGNTGRFARTARVARAAFAATIAIALAFIASAAAHAQGRTDVVTLANGDRITGEVVRLERGRLEFKTDDAGTLSLEWDKLASLVAARIVEVVTTDGRRFVGTLTPATARATLAVATPAAALTLPMIEVTAITPIGRSFWRKLDGSFDAGFSYTQSSGIAQLNLNSETVYRKPAGSNRTRASASGCARSSAAPLVRAWSTTIARRSRPAPASCSTTNAASTSRPRGMWKRSSCSRRRTSRTIVRRRIWM